jgi:hypothetical protein
LEEIEIELDFAGKSEFLTTVYFIAMNLIAQFYGRLSESDRWIHCGLIFLVVRHGDISHFDICERFIGTNFWRYFSIAGS